MPDKREVSMGRRLGLGIVIAAMIILPAQAQDGFQPGPWQPIARVEPTQQVTVLITNTSGATIEYDMFSTQVPLPQLQPGESASLVLGSLPTSINISALSAPPFSEIPLDFTVSELSGNSLQIEVGIEFIDNFGGDRVLTVDEAGGVYIY